MCYTSTVMLNLNLLHLNRVAGLQEILMLNAKNKVNNILFASHIKHLEQSRHKDSFKIKMYNILYKFFMCKLTLWILQF